MSHRHLSHLSDPKHPLVEGAPLKCDTCKKKLCLRKQVVNLALGNVDEMYCLNCLAEENDQTPQDVLENIMEYVQQRDCFRKEWNKYLSVEYCPDKKKCFPSICFQGQCDQD